MRKKAAKKTAKRQEVPAYKQAGLSFDKWNDRRIGRKTMSKPLDALVTRLKKKHKKTNARPWSSTQIVDRSKPAINREGMTLLEWTRAANAFRRVPLDASLARKEWQAGVDPTEYADHS